ncbi:hypothetical protein PPL_11167 [Heterostelium album PN500]|uniref:Pre-rRNA-processing protein Ipi1 N-terminal domain-containing protein n=1 Tax=Heterostelium pallidum (strain ATCC 26659 / Pp 5 / PN500) TaxID=670386 RepID=D3BTQ7_HETP5|nr:hypothetical protein PPL_11167 [Heterostelium album PN500]EFA75093.1 hypothetical protein PPL_11167 [Heterostelium album PN500]|eukprot:XP_020427227.1 hypothetical protein PPL_11167 [Heterostelium album PN500]
MGRSKSKKTNQPSLDFKVKKKKLGKKPPPNPNVTVTTFKSKTLYIPGQSIGEKDDPITNQRNLTLKDLLSKTKHYSEQIRRDSLNGLKDLIQMHPVVVSQHIGAIMNGIVESVNDTDKNVRLAAHSLIAKVLPLVDPIMMSPFLPLFAIYITSGMTHLKSSIRMDSLQLFELLITQFPQMIGFSHQILPNYLELLKRVGIHTTSSLVLSNTSVGSSTSLSAIASATNTGGGNAASGASGMKNNQLGQRIQILQSLFKLLERLLPSEQQHQRLLSKVKSSNSLTRQWAVQTPLASTFTNYTERTVFTSFFSQTGSSTGKISSRALESATETLDFTASVMPILIECWLELTPGNPGSHSTLLDMELIVKMLMLLITKIREDPNIGGSASKSNPNNEKFDRIRQDYLKYFAAHYPVLVGSSDNPDSKEYSASQEINAIVTQTLAWLLPTSIITNTVGSGSSKSILPSWFEPAIDFFEDALDGKLVKEGERGQAVRTSISSYLWVVIKVLPSLSQERAQSVLESFIKFDNQCNPLSTAKKACVFFIKELIDIQDSLKDKSIKKIIEWGLSSLPKLLWRIGASDSNTSLMIITILLSFGKDKNKRGQYESIQNSLVPFLFTISKPSDKFPQGKHVYGPFIHLPIDLQIQSLYLIYYFTSINLLTIRALIAICKSPKVSIEVKERIFDIIYYKFDQGFGLDNYLAFCISITLAMIHKVEDNGDEQQQIDLDGVTDLDADNNNNNNNNSSLKRKHDKIMNNDSSSVDIQHRDRVLNRIFRDINHLRSTIPIKKVLNPLLASVLRELDNQTLDGKKYILQLIYSCFNSKDQEEWSSVPKSLVDSLPAILSSYLLTIEQQQLQQKSLITNLKDSYISLAHQYIQLDQSTTLLVNLLKQMSSELKADKSKLVVISIILMDIIKNKQMESLLHQQEAKDQLQLFVNEISTQPNILEEEKPIVDKLLSEFKMSHNKL